MYQAMTVSPADCTPSCQLGLLVPTAPSVSWGLRLWRVVPAREPVPAPPNCRSTFPEVLPPQGVDERGLAHVGDPDHHDAGLHVLEAQGQGVGTTQPRTPIPPGHQRAHLGPPHPTCQDPRGVPGLGSAVGPGFPAEGAGPRPVLAHQPLLGDGDSCSQPAPWPSG